MKWSSEEVDYLNYLIYRAWDWHFPGYSWVTSLLNDEFKNGRTVSAVRQKYYKILKAERCDL